MTTPHRHTFTRDGIVIEGECPKCSRIINGESEVRVFDVIMRFNRGEWRRGDTTTNSIESLWSLVKRTYVGTHHWWSKKHTQRYLDGCTFRLNVASGEHVLELLACGLNPDAILPYKELTA